MGEDGRAALLEFQEKYTLLKENTEAQTQYVKELETVLQAQGDGTQQVVKSLSERATSAEQELQKVSAEARHRQQGQEEELRMLRLQLRRHEDEANATNRLDAANQPPPLPEASTTWTLRSKPDATQQPEHLAPLGHGDSGRKVNRSLPRFRPTSHDKCHSHPSTARRCLRETFDAEPSPRRRVEEVNQELRMLRKRCEAADVRGAQHRRLLGFCQWGMHLLRGIFEELRENWNFQDATDPEKGDGTLGAMVAPGVDSENANDNGELHARDVLRRIVGLFCSVVPKLGNFAELLAALGEALADAEELAKLKQGSTCSQSFLGDVGSADLTFHPESTAAALDGMQSGADESLAMPDDPLKFRRDSAESSAIVSECGSLPGQRQIEEEL